MAGRGGRKRGAVRKRRLPAVLVLDDWGQAVEAAASERRYTDLSARDAAIVAVILNGGLRRAEVCSLCVRDAAEWSEEAGWKPKELWRVIGKGDKERAVAMGPPGLSETEAYLDVRPDLRPGPERTSGKLEAPFPLFVSRNGGRLDGSSIYRLWRRALEEIGRPDLRNPHSGRHSHATGCRADGWDLDEIADQLGHESLDTTRIYTQVAAAARLKRARTLGSGGGTDPDRHPERDGG